MNEFFNRENLEHLTNSQTFPHNEGGLLSVIEEIKGRVHLGKPLPAPVLMAVEFFFQTELSAVRIHISKLPARLNAKACVYGNEVYIDDNYSDFYSLQGMAVLLHELTHVIQQRQKKHLNKATTILHDELLEKEAVDNELFAHEVICHMQDHCMNTVTHHHTNSTSHFIDSPVIQLSQGLELELGGIKVGKAKKSLTRKTTRIYNAYDKRKTKYGRKLFRTSESSTIDDNNFNPVCVAAPAVEVEVDVRSINFDYEWDGRYAMPEVISKPILKRVVHGSDEYDQVRRDCTGISRFLYQLVDDYNEGTDKTYMKLSDVIELYNNAAANNEYDFLQGCRKLAMQEDGQKIYIDLDFSSRCIEETGLNKPIYTQINGTIPIEYLAFDPIREYISSLKGNEAKKRCWDHSVVAAHYVVDKILQKYADDHGVPDDIDGYAEKWFRKLRGLFVLICYSIKTASLDKAHFGVNSHAKNKFIVMPKTPIFYAFNYSLSTTSKQLLIHFLSDEGNKKSLYKWICEACGNNGARLKRTKYYGNSGQLGLIVTDFLDACFEIDEGLDGDYRDTCIIESTVRGFDYKLALNSDDPAEKETHDYLVRNMIFEKRYGTRSNLNEIDQDLDTLTQEWDSFYAFDNDYRENASQVFGHPTENMVTSWEAEVENIIDLENERAMQTTYRGHVICDSGNYRD